MMSTSLAGCCSCIILCMLLSLLIRSDLPEPSLSMLCLRRSHRTRSGIQLVLCYSRDPFDLLFSKTPYQFGSTGNKLHRRIYYWALATTALPWSICQTYPPSPIESNTPGEVICVYMRPSTDADGCLIITDVCARRSSHSCNGAPSCFRNNTIFTLVA